MEQKMSAGQPAQHRYSKKQWRALGASLNLTPRELEIVRTLLDVETAPAAARRLDISQNTVRTHLKRIYSKLSVTNRVGLVLLVVDELAAQPGD